MDDFIKFLAEQIAISASVMRDSEIPDGSLKKNYHRGRLDAFQEVYAKRNELKEDISRQIRRAAAKARNDLNLKNFGQGL